MRMFARRRRGLVASLATIVALLAVGVVVVLAQNAELERGQQVLREQNVELERRGRVSRRVARFAQDFLAESSLMSARGRDYTVREALDVAAANLADETFEDPEIEAELQQLIGGTYRSLSLPAVAEPHLRRARELWLQVEGAGSPRAVRCAVDLLVALREQGKTGAARAVVDAMVAQFPEAARGDALWWTVQHHRAYVLRHEGRLREAMDLFVEVLAARERLLGPEHDDTIVTMHNLGNLQLHLDRFEAAERTLSAAVQRCRDGNVPAASRLQIEDNLAEVWRELGRLDEAAQKHREMMAEYDAMVGPDHQITIGCGYHLLKVLYAQRAFEELHELATDLLVRCERTFGERDYRTMDVRSQRTSRSVASSCSSSNSRCA
jgi:tetratricopeptide (TPR) repeat protein